MSMFKSYLIRTDFRVLDSHKKRTYNIHKCTSGLFIRFISDTIIMNLTLPVFVHVFFFLYAIHSECVRVCVCYLFIYHNDCNNKNIFIDFFILITAIVKNCTPYNVHRHILVNDSVYKITV